MKDSDAGKSCQYLASNGTKCAVGCLLTKREYKPLMEGNSVFVLLNEASSAYAPELAAKIGDNLQLVSAMQTIHDNQPVKTWEQHFANVAQEHHLTVPKKVK